MISKIADFLEIKYQEFVSINNKFSEEFYSDELKNETMNLVKAISVFYNFNIENDFTKNYDIAIRQHRAKNPITVSQSTTLKINAPEWLTIERMKALGWGSEEVNTFRDRYLEYLKKIGRSEKLIKETSRSTLNIVKNLGDPENSEGFYKKGMVVGSVQSGKTANFNGVINTAVDAGYRIVIVLSGLMEDLRIQTQRRIENDVIGPLGAGGRGIGVGEDHPFLDKALISVTSEESDFNRNLLQANFNIHKQQNILICKKNVSILRNILLWLHEYVNEQHPIIDIPLLIIDDEADNASLNNLGFKGREYATRTNKEIRSILALFSKKSYLGYTATPFANVLQDRNESSEKQNCFDYNNIPYKMNMVDNLFPDDFIELLYPPSNYIGIKHFFDTRNDQIKKIESLLAPPINIDDPDYFLKIPPRFLKSSDLPTTSTDRDTRSANKYDIYPNKIDGLPESLKDAVKCFVISIAIRLSRENIMIKSPFYQKHHTMLVHISLFGTWQNRCAKILEEYLKELKESLSFDALDRPVWSEFERIWNKYYFYIINNIQNDFSNGFSDPYLVAKDFTTQIKPLLNAAAKDIEVKSINSFTGDNLIYPKKMGKKYIAVGGNRLSRGFTLEGLTINYFLRKANTADTLMQMGRWFGYRPGYLDCCKLFTTSDNIEKFNEASLIMEDLENKFNHLSRLPGRTPRDYTLWIRNNPDVIKLTRPSFLKGLTSKNLSFGDTVEQSTQFELKRDKILSSLAAFRDHVKNINWKPEAYPGFLIHDTDQVGLMSFINLPNVMMNLNIIGLKDYLEQCNSMGKLQKWRIAVKVVSKSDSQVLSKEQSGLPHDIKMIKRSGPTRGSDPDNPKNAFLSLTKNNIFKARNATIISPSDFAITLSPEKKLEAESSEGATSDRAYRAKMDESTGILIIYLLDLQKVFNIDDENSASELLNYAMENNLHSLKNVPLIGYALGFPDITGVDGGRFVSQHVFKEPEDMTLEELMDYVKERDFGIDLDKKNWTKKNLLSEIMEYEEDLDGEELPKDIINDKKI